MATHKNKWTGEELSQATEVCGDCHKNFKDTPSGDAHRTTKFTCLEPAKAGLVATTNQYGSTIYARTLN